MEEFKRVVKVLAVRRLRNSYYGNPKWDETIQYVNGVFDDDIYNVEIATTQENASCGYLFSSYSVGKRYEITFHFTRTGKQIITFAKEVHTL